jgi:hypothetical protein
MNFSDINEKWRTTLDYESKRQHHQKTNFAKCLCSHSFDKRRHVPAVIESDAQVRELAFNRLLYISWTNMDGCISRNYLHSHKRSYTRSEQMIINKLQYIWTPSYTIKTCFDESKICLMTTRAIGFIFDNEVVDKETVVN